MTHKFWIPLALAVSVSLASLPALSAEAPKTFRSSVSVTREYQQANLNLQTGRYQLAESQFLSVLKRNPSSLKARAGLALVQAELYKLDAAEKNANQVLSKNPNSAMAHTALGTIARNRTSSLDMTYKARRNELLNESVDHLKRALEVSPGSPEIWNQLGLTYSLQGRTADAHSAFERALKADPHFAEARVNEGVMQLQKGNVSGAKAAYQQAIRLNSKNYAAHYRLGEAYLKEGNSHQALQSLNTALALNPGNGSVLSKMAEAYRSQGNSSAAVTTYQKAMLSSPGFMPAYLGLANIYDGQGDGELAMATLKSAINVNPNFTAGYKNLGRLALSVDKPDQAMQYYQEALKVNSQDSEALQGLSQALMVTAQRTSVESNFSGQESNLADAEEMLDAALRLNPNDMGLRLASLRIAQLAGKPQASEEELNQILETPARNDAERFIQGQAYYALGHYPQSDAIFREQIAKAGQNPQKLLVIGDTLKAEGNLALAREAYQAVPGNNLKAKRAINRIAQQQAQSDKSLRLAKALNKKSLLGLKRAGQQSAIDSYEEALSKNPRQPEARLALSKLYEKYDQYDKAALSYQMYLGLMPGLTENERAHFEEKIQKLRQATMTVGQ